jgi:hypothetical protein
MADQKPMAIQLKDEPTQDYIKFLVFVSMGAHRSLNKAFQQYYETGNQVSDTWRALADKYRWTERATEHDKGSTQTT